MYDDENYIRKRWEGKPFSFKLKYFYANFPELAICSAICCTIVPALLTYRLWTYKGSRDEAITKYKLNYVVVRDDHPNIEKIKEEKERSRHLFPQF